jgi:hypothetical protein
MPTPPGSGSYYPSPVSNYTYGSPGYSNLPKPPTAEQIPEPNALDEEMPDSVYDY